MQHSWIYSCSQKLGRSNDEQMKVCACDGPSGVMETGKHTWRKGGKSSYITRADNCTPPVSHKQVIAVVHSIADSAIADTFFAFLKLLQQSEIPWNCRRIMAIRKGRRCVKTILGAALQTLSSTCLKMLNWIIAILFPSLPL